MKNKIEKKLKRKTNEELVKTILLCKGKNEKIANILTNPRRKKINLNLKDIESQSKKDELILVPGKILGSGEIKKSLKIVALEYSETAIEKLKKEKIEYSTIFEELSKNKDLSKFKILIGGVGRK
jgi:large subunit ribosomal protein L18e